MNNATIMYHYIRNWNYPSFSKKEFKTQVEDLLQNRKNISVKEMLKEEKKPTFTLTFDDGLKDGYTNAFPILESLGAKATFFIPMKIFTEKKVLNVQKRHLLLEKLGTENFVEEFNTFLIGDFYRIKDEGENNGFDDSLTSSLKAILDWLPEAVSKQTLGKMFNFYFDEEKEFDKMYLNREELEELAEAGMEFGTHGFNHCYLNRLQPLVMKKELEKTFRVFDLMFPNKLPIISYPMGSYNIFTKRILKDLGCVIGFTTKENYNSDLTKPLELNRFDCTKWIESGGMGRSCCLW